MARAFSAALHNELSKYARQKFPYLGMLAVILLAVFWVRGYHLMSRGEDTSAFTVVIQGTIAAVTSIIPIFAALFASVLVASETAGGTYRNVLSRPISRVEFLTAKVVFAFGYALLLILLHIAAISIAAATRYSFGPVVDEGEVIVSTGRLIAVFHAAIGLTLIPLLAIVSYGIMVSTLAKSLANALGIGVGVLIAIEPIKHLVRWGDWRLSDYVMTSYLDTPLAVAKSASMGFEHEWWTGSFWTSDIGWGIMLSLGAMGLFLFISYFTFLRRDLNFS